MAAGDGPAAGDDEVGHDPVDRSDGVECGASIPDEPKGPQHSGGTLAEPTERSWPAEGTPVGEPEDSRVCVLLRGPASAGCQNRYQMAAQSFALGFGLDEVPRRIAWPGGIRGGDKGDSGRRWG